jgi:TetR/AcrR family transcriptional regulator, transcriptional repressor of aconitase
MGRIVKKTAGRPETDHGKRQREVADVLLRVIGEQGFEKASMRMVAREAGCTTGVLSHYFSSKEDLVCHAVNLMFDWIDRQTEAASHVSDRLEAIRIALGTSEDTEPLPFDFWAVWLQVLSKAKQSRRLTQIINERHGKFRNALTRLIVEGQEQLQLRGDVNAELLADYVNAVSDGLGLMMPIESKRLSKKRRNDLMTLCLNVLAGGSDQLPRQR